MLVETGLPGNRPTGSACGRGEEYHAERDHNQIQAVFGDQGNRAVDLQEVLIGQHDRA